MAAAPISVVIPAHDEERFLAEAIYSVQAQTLPPTEVIVVADACKDRTAEIAAELGAIVVEQNRHNMAAALNVGIKASSQSWIALLDADDLWDKRKLAWQWKAIQDCPAAALIACDLSLLVGERVSPIWSARQRRDRWKGFDYVTVSDNCKFLEKIPGEFLPIFNLGTPTVMLRRDVFPRVGLFDETLTFLQAQELFARVMAAYPIAYVEKSLVLHRRHDRNHTRNPVAFWPTYISIINRMLKNPDLYPEGAGRVYRELLKDQFRHFEREIARGNFDGDEAAGIDLS